MPPLESCCCGFNLRVGTLIIGWLSLVYGLFKLFVGSIMDVADTSFLGKIINVIMNEAAKESQGSYPSLTPDDIPTGNFITVDSIMRFVNVGMAIALIVLASFDKKKMLKWWVNLSSLLYVLVFLWYIFAGEIMKSIFFFFTYCIIDLYGLLVVYSFALTEDGPFPGQQMSTFKGPQHV